MNKKVLYLVHGAVIAALYVVLTMLANALGLANYAIQVRFSEALTILPVFTPAAIPGLFLGCIVLAYVYHLEGGIPYFMLTVGIGEIISCGVLGMLLRTVLQKYRKYIFDVQK